MSLEDLASMHAHAVLPIEWEEDKDVLADYDCIPLIYKRRDIHGQLWVGLWVDSDNPQTMERHLLIKVADSFAEEYTWEHFAELFLRHFADNTTSYLVDTELVHTGAVDYYSVESRDIHKDYLPEVDPK